MQDQLHSSQRKRALRPDTSFADDASGDITFKTADAEWCQAGIRAQPAVLALDA